MSSRACVQCQHGFCSVLLWSALATVFLFRTCLSQAVLQYNVTEEQAADVDVTDVAQVSDIQGRYQIDIDNLQCSISEQTGATRDILFKTGDGCVLRTAVKIDRDAICAQESTCHLELMINILQRDPMEYLETVKVEIEILDLNDNAPEFEEKTLYLPENVQKDSVLAYPVASDPDSPRYAVQTYQQLSGMDTFQLVETSVPVHAESIQLRVLTTLNREHNDGYTVEIVAYDGDTPPRSGTVTINIVVTDVNDNNPVFEQDSYSAIIPEDLEPYSFVLKVAATDADIDANGEIVYGFLQTSDTFEIDNTTGEISTVRKLDYEEARQYKLVVTAQNPIPNVVPTTASIIITIENVDDNLPSIKVDPLSPGPSGEVEVSEADQRDKDIAQLTVSDPDQDKDNQEFFCNLDTSDFKVIGDAEFKKVFLLRTSVQFDREAQSIHNVTVTCTNLGNPTQKAVKVIPVYVMDINDNPPVFDKLEYRTSTVENQPRNTQLLQVSATDADVAENGKIAYSIDPAVQSKLLIDPVSGNISVKTRLDRETSSVLVFNVTAHDQGSPSRSAVTLVTIFILDANDEMPIFTRTTYHFNVLENKDLDTEVGQVEAFDKDGSNFNKFQYSLDSVDNGNNLFWIDAETGSIYTHTDLDRELVAEYKLVVLATSFSLVPTTGSATVIIEVEDINDNRPEFIFPRPGNDTLELPTEYRIGDVLTKVSARDKDMGQNAIISYSIVKVDGKGSFSIDLQSGEITQTAGGFPNGVTLTIQARDNGKIPLVATSLLHIPDEESSGELSQQNVIIVIAIACVTGFILVILVFVIVCVVRRNRKQKRKRKENEAVAAAKEADGKNGNNMSSKDGNRLLLPGIPRGRAMDSDGEAMYNEAMTTDDELDMTGGFKPLQHAVLDAEMLERQRHRVDGDPYPRTYLNHIHPAARADRLDRQVSNHRGQDPDRQQRGPYYINGKRINPHVHESMNMQGDRDSDSGCSADLSHSTMDSGRGSNTEIIFDQNQPNGMPPRPNKPPPYIGYTRPPIYYNPPPLQPNGYHQNPYRPGPSSYELKPFNPSAGPPQAPLQQSRSNSMNYRPSILEEIVEDHTRSSSFTGTAESYQREGDSYAARLNPTAAGRYDPNYRRPFVGTPVQFTLTEEEHDRTYCQEATV